MPAVHGLQSLLRGIAADLGEGRKVQVAGVSSTLAELLVLALASDEASKEPHCLIVVVPTAKELPPWSHFLDAAAAGLGPAAALSAAVLPFYSAYGNDRFINAALSRRQRLYALARLSQPVGRTVLVTTLAGLAQKTLAPALLRTATLTLRTGEEHDQDRLISDLDDLGYLPAAAVQEEGTFAVRGGIVDVFAVNGDQPVRLEFVGDTLASLRPFSPTDQRSRSEVGLVEIVPAYEALAPAASRKDDAQRLFNVLLELQMARADRDGMLAQFQKGVKFAGFDMFAPLFRPAVGTGLDYAAARAKGALLVFPRGERACLEAYEAHYDTVGRAARHDQDRHVPVLPLEEHFLPPADVAAALAGLGRSIEFGNPYATASASLYRMEARLSVKGAPVSESYGAELFDKWAEVIARVIREDGGRVAVFAHHDEQVERIATLLGHRGLNPSVDPALMARVARADLPAGSVSVGKGDFASHLWLEDVGLLVLPEQVLFGTRPKKAKPASQKLQNYLSSFADLKPSDLVVHVQHGIGCYKGLTSLTVAGLVSDFLILEYAGGDKIYLPVDRLSLLQRYGAGDANVGHTLDKLGGPGWDKRKGKAKTAIRDMADELLKLHARRAVAAGHAYGAPDDAYFTFEGEFPFDETEDQTRAIHDVEADLRSGKPMDRLVCGDVGFGKTEVALRAAMRTVLEGFQVLVLVPTTVLCYQHYRTFKERLERHGVRVAQVSRFVKAADAQVALEGLASGAVDVLIGTHRLLSKDVKPRRLGLLVVDEEQRFGVSHKEKLKELRAGAHVLTLTATPIPRTLHMAMVGMRDISIIATAPQDRLAVKTYISRFDEALIKDAIEQEVRRGGQVFFVHNRVEDILELRLFLKALVPHAEVRVAHGQMKEHQLEDVIVAFLEQKFQVLLCTTIIESGIDMPNVNTLIVGRADRFGLSQLYQLRGRVGRANLQAYAYFLTPPHDHLAEEAQRRLDVLAAHQELGAGFQIASHDLELRGAGNLLGGEQSGYASSVGLELYTEMLDQAIHELRGEPVPERIDTEIKLPVSALIPPAYVAEETQRLQLYKNLFAAEGEDDLRALRASVVDRFGPLPPPLALLFKVARLKQQLCRLGALRLSAGKGGFEVRFAALPDAQVDRLLKVSVSHPDRYRIAPDGRLLLLVSVPDRPTVADQDALLTALLALVAPLAEELG